MNCDCSRGTNVGWLLLQLPTQVAAPTRMKCRRVRKRRRRPRDSPTSACATSTSTCLDDARSKLPSKVVFLLFQSFTQTNFYPLFPRRPSTSTSIACFCVSVQTHQLFIPERNSKTLLKKLLLIRENKLAFTSNKIYICLIIFKKNWACSCAQL